MTAPSDIFLKWNSHHDVLVSLLYSQLEKKNFVDVTIGAEGKFVNAHRLILCAASEYFEEILGQQHQPAAVILQNVKFCDVQSIIEYIYKGEVSLSGDQLESFLGAAKSLKIKGLIHKENNPNQVQEPTVTMEIPPAPEQTSDSIRPVQEEAESVDQSENPIMLETEENLNHQVPIQQMEQDVVIVEPEPRPAPVVVNLEETMVEEEQVPEQSASENQDGSPIPNESDDEDSSSDDEEMDPQGNETQSDANRPTSAGFYNCGACGRAYKTNLALKRHKLKFKCQTVPYYRCALCVVCNDSKGGLKSHISRSHKNLLPSQFDDYIVKIEPTLIACKVCSYRCKDPASLQRHNRREHEGFRGF